MEISHAAEDCEFFSPSCHPASFWLYLGMSVALVMFAGLMGGLTMGLVSLDMLNMRILEMEGTPIEKQRAARVIPIISRHHLLLVTLLLGNACANEALPIFLSKLVPESVSIIISVTCVLMFGEIIPSAIFTGPNQLRIASALTPFMRAFMTVASPISYPIAKFLDWWLGADHNVARYKRQELKALIALQRETEVLQHTVRKARRSRRRKQNLNGIDEEEEDEDHVHSDYTRFEDAEEPYDHTSARRSQDFSHHNSAQSTRLHVDEVTIIHGALDLTAKTVREVMIPMEQVYMLQYDTKLNDNVMADILASGHSRIPIFRDHPSNIVGLLLVKRLIVVDPEDERPVHDLALRKPIVVSPEESCYYVLNEFQKGHSHIAVITKDAKLVQQCWQDGVDIPESVTFEGIITIEDIIEELIQEEIEDESDMYVHDVVDYWKAKAARDASNAQAKASGSQSFVQQRLRVLAERARTRVRTRKTKKRASLPATSASMEPTIEVRVVSEDQLAPNAA